MTSKTTILKLVRYSCNLSIKPKMRAWQIYKYGDLDQLTLTNSYQTPAISSPNHVLIKVKAASVNPIDIGLTSGYGASMFNIAKQLNDINEFPITLGRDFSGTVIKVGHLVHDFQPGMDVIGALYPFEQGCYSEYVSCNQHQLAPKPSNLTHIAAASLPYAGLTAYSSLVDFGGLQASGAPNKRVLIIGSGGGVGTLAVQIAKSLGAHVTVTCRGHQEELLKKLGADDILLDSVTTTADSKFALILDCTGADIKRFSKLLNGGPCSRYVTLRHALLKTTDDHPTVFGLGIAAVDFVTTFARNAILTGGSIFQWAFFRASGTNLRSIVDMVETGSVVPVLHKEFEFNDVPAACRTLAEGSISGKVVVRLEPDDDEERESDR